MLPFYLQFVYTDSSVERFFVVATSKEKAINTIVDKYLISKPIKFVIVDDSPVVESEGTKDWCTNFKVGANENTLEFENELNGCIGDGHFSVNIVDLVKVIRNTSN